jgi:arylsulfatase A-like enzyme
MNKLLIISLLIIYFDQPLQAKQRPNVIIILTDDMGYGDFGCHGNPHIKTPNIDALHAKSVRFTNFHVGTTCSPTRAMLMTGKNNNQVGVWHTVNGREMVDKEEIMLPAMFKKAGYRTGIFGKWHLGDSYPFRPQDRGFDEVLVHGGGGVGHAPDFWGNDYFDDTYFRNGKPEAFKGYCDDVWFTEAMHFMEQQKDKPFFCYIPTNVAHGPYNIAPEYAKPYQGNPNVPNANFAGMITKSDENIGKLMAFLKYRGLEKNTIVLFMTDNGTAEGARLDSNEFVQKGFNAQMRGKKGSVYEGGHRVPLFLYDPTRDQKARDIDILASGMDIAPTLLDLCKIKIKNNFQGISLSPILQGKTLPARILIADTQREEYLTKNLPYSVMTQQWRLVNGKELYNIKKDAEQRHDLSVQFPDTVANLKQQYENWWQMISVQKNEYQRFIVGSKKEMVVCLTGHDLHVEKGSPPWHQSMIQNERGENGFWAIETEQNGTYAFELRRFPRESAAKIPSKYVNAKMEINGQVKTTEIAANSEKIIFTLTLPKGKHNLKTWLTTSNDNAVAATYVYVQKL